MKMSYIIPIVVGGGLLYYFTKGKTAKNLKIYLDGVKFGSVKGLSLPDTFVRFKIINPTNNSITITSLAGDLKINNKDFASISNTEKFDIPGNKEVFYSVKITAPIISVLQTIYNYFKAKQKLKLSFDGIVNSTGVTIPINQTIFQS